MDNEDNPAMEPDDPDMDKSFLMGQENQENNVDQEIDYRIHYRAAKALVYHTYNFLCLTPIGNYQANLQLNPRLAAAIGFKMAVHGLIYHIDHRTPSNVTKTVLDKRNALRRQYLQLKVEDPQQYSDSDFAALAYEMTGPLQVLFSALEDHYSQ